MWANIYRQRLYGKFGGFYGVKQLNIVEDPLSLIDMIEGLTESGGDEAFDPLTGLPIDSDEDYFFAIADPQCVSFDARKPVYYLSRKNIKRTMSAGIGVVNAMRELAEWGYKGAMIHLS